MKWFLPGQATLNTHINVKSIEDILYEQQTNQEPDEEEDKHEEAITQKTTCNEAIEHLNALQCFVEVPRQIWTPLWDMEKHIFQQTEKNYKQSTQENLFKKPQTLCVVSLF
jgi:hypothetical protein